MQVTHRAAPFIVFIGALAILGCGPRAVPPQPGPGPTASKQSDKAAVQQKLPRPDREVLIGEMCPTAAAGRPAVIPMFARRVTWILENSELNRPLETRSARQFSVFAWNGGRAGLFSVAGAADIGLDRLVAVGSYAGASPCEKRDKNGATSKDAACVASQHHCGLAIAVLEQPSGFRARPFDEDPDPPQFRRAGACVSGDKLLVDLDGDGSVEAFPVRDLLDPVRAPAEEVFAVARGKASCTPTFSVRNAIPPANPLHWRGLDILGVADVDGDGRAELVLSYHYSDRRTWAVYSAPRTAARLELMGEAVPFPRP